MARARIPQTAAVRPVHASAVHPGRWLALGLLISACSSAPPPSPASAAAADPRARETRDRVEAAEAAREARRFEDRLARLRAAQDRRPPQRFTDSATVAAAGLLEHGVDPRLLSGAARAGAPALSSGSSLRALRMAPAPQVQLAAAACWLRLQATRVERQLKWGQGPQDRGALALALYELNALAARVKAARKRHPPCDGCDGCVKPPSGPALAELEAALSGVETPWRALERRLTESGCLPARPQETP